MSELQVTKEDGLMRIDGNEYFHFLRVDVYKGTDHSTETGLVRVVPKGEGLSVHEDPYHLTTSDYRNREIGARLLFHCEEDDMLYTVGVHFQKGQIFFDVIKAESPVSMYSEENDALVSQN
jgi:hypothetical protein